jgi:hypothetical protein
MFSGYLCTALAAVSDDDSLQRLVSIAMTDADESVRVRAFAELVRLERSKQETAVAFITAAVDEKETKGAANYLLSQLQLAGLPVSHRPKNLGEAVEGIRASIAYAGRGRTFVDTWSLIGKSILAAFVASTIGVSLTYGYIRLLVGQLAGAQAFFISIFGTVLLAALTIYFICPFGEYFVRSFVAPIAAFAPLNKQNSQCEMKSRPHRLCFRFFGVR